MKHVCLSLSKLFVLFVFCVLSAHIRLLLLFLVHGSSTVDCLVRLISEAGPDLGLGTRGLGARPPTNTGPPTKPFNTRTYRPMLGYSEYYPIQSNPMCSDGRRSSLPAS